MKIDYPTELTIDLNLPKILKVSARVAVRLIKTQIRAAQDAQGRSIPRPKVIRKGQPAPRRPMIRTGEALKSIKATKVKQGATKIKVFPAGYHTYDGSAIPLVVNVLQKRHGLKLIALNKDHETAVTNAVQEEIDRQLTAKEAKGVKGSKRTRRKS